VCTPSVNQAIYVYKMCVCHPCMMRSVKKKTKKTLIKRISANTNPNPNPNSIPNLKR